MKDTFEEIQPWMEDSLVWKTTFDGRQPSMEDDLWWKTTLDGKQPLVEDEQKIFMTTLLPKKIK